MSIRTTVARQYNIPVVARSVRTDRLDFVGDVPVRHKPGAAAAYYRKNYEYMLYVRL